MDICVEFLKNINNSLQQKFTGRHIDMSCGGLYNKTLECLDMTLTSMQSHLKVFSDTGDELSMYALTNESIVETGLAVAAYMTANTDIPAWNSILVMW